MGDNGDVVWFDGELEDGQYSSVASIASGVVIKSRVSLSHAVSPSTTVPLRMKFCAVVFTEGIGSPI